MGEYLPTHDFGKKCKRLHNHFGGIMKKKQFSKIRMHELLPYIIFVLFIVLLMNVGMLCVIHTFTVKEEFREEMNLERYEVGGAELNGERVRGWPEFLAAIKLRQHNYEEGMYWMVFVVNLLAILGGAALLAWQLVRYVVPAENMIDYMQAGSDVYHRDLSYEIIGSLEDYKACKLRLEQMESVAQTEFIGKLLNAEFKSEGCIRAEAENVGLEVYGYQYLVLFAGIFNNVSDEDVDAATIYESAVVLDYLKLKMDWGEHLPNIWFRKISYKRMIIVLQLQNPFHMEVLRELQEEFLRIHGVNLFWGVGRLCEDPLYLWKCKEEAHVAINCCDMRNSCVEYTPGLETGMKCYLPGVARNNLVAYIRAGNTSEISKILALLKEENCVRRKLSHSQFVALNARVIRMLGKFQELDNCDMEGIIDGLNEFVLQDDGSHEEYFDRLKSGCMEICAKCNEEKQDKKTELAGEIKSYIDAHYQDSSLSLTRLGVEFNISDSYVSLIFKEYIGIKFSTYVEEIRIRYATELLEGSSLTVREVAERTGYTSEQSFRRAFKKVTGLSPKDAREAMSIRKSS